MVITRYAWYSIPGGHYSFLGCCLAVMRVSRLTVSLLLAGCYGIPDGCYGISHCGEYVPGGCQGVPKWLLWYSTLLLANSRWLLWDSRWLPRCSSMFWVLAMEFQGVARVFLSGCYCILHCC